MALTYTYDPNIYIVASADITSQPVRQSFLDVKDKFDTGLSTSDLGDDCVTGDKISDAVVGSNHLTSNAVTNEKLYHTDGHLVFTPSTSKLVKIAVLRQNITTNVYSNNSVILTGWMYAQGDGVNTYKSVAINFGITFAAAPIVLTSACYKKQTSAPTDITELNSPDQRPFAITGAMSTTGFNFIMCFNYVAPNTQYHGGTWIAIGVLS